MNRKNFVRVLGVDPRDWARRFGIEPFYAECCECGAPTVTTVPFTSINGELRGLLSPECECGNQNTPYCMVTDRRFGDLFNLPDLSGRKRSAARSA